MNASARPAPPAEHVTSAPRASGTDDAVKLTPPTIMSLEQAIAYIDDDELVEVTPNAIRLRKRFLDPHERKRQAKASA